MARIISTTKLGVIISGVIRERRRLAFPTYRGTQFLVRRLSPSTYQALWYPQRTKLFLRRVSLNVDSNCLSTAPTPPDSASGAQLPVHAPRSRLRSILRRASPTGEPVVKKENIWTIPNALCVMRIGAAPVLAYMILHNQFMPAVTVFALAGVSDLLDGWIARTVPGQSTVMGSFLDPMADKILVGTLFLSLTYIDKIPVALTSLIIGRDIILILFGFYIRYQSLDPPRTLTRYFNVTYPTAQLAPTLISKINTGVQLGLVGATLVSTVLPFDVHPYLEGLWYVTAATTIASAVGYCFAKDTVKLLRRPTSSSQNVNAEKPK